MTDQELSALAEKSLNVDYLHPGLTFDVRGQKYLMMHPTKKGRKARQQEALARAEEIITHKEKRAKKIDLTNAQKGDVMIVKIQVGLGYEWASDLPGQDMVLSKDYAEEVKILTMYRSREDRARARPRPVADRKKQALRAIIIDEKQSRYIKFRCLDKDMNPVTGDHYAYTTENETYEALASVEPAEGVILVSIVNCKGIIIGKFGCTDKHASNYNDLATIDDGTCMKGQLTSIYTDASGGGRSYRKRRTSRKTKRRSYKKKRTSRKRKKRRYTKRR